MIKLTRQQVTITGILPFFFFILFSSAIAQSFNVVSPDKAIVANVQLDKDGSLFYSITYKATQVLKPSHLGLVSDSSDFWRGLRILGASPSQTVYDSYKLYTGKKRFVNYVANKRTFNLAGSNGKKMSVIFQVSNDGVAFRYYLPEAIPGEHIIAEKTTYHLDTASRGFLQPVAEAKSGWEHTNPSYEEHYLQNISTATPAPANTGWVYPALFSYRNTWLLITEAGLNGSYCATRLGSNATNGEYQVSFPDDREVIAADGLLPVVRDNFYTPWRIITIGNLKTIIESTLGTDLAEPAISFDKSFIRPGKAAWSWIMSKDDFIVYDEQVRYIDFAAEMKWRYCLIDADWDRKIGYDKIKQLAEYAAGKNVGLLLWYNSAGEWNTVKYTPKNKLLTHEDRMKEFARLKNMGIKGVKIDFFGGDGRSVINYYIDILQDAAANGLMVNFHGATLPRGWQRTYPNLVSTEAVKGFEMVTFGQSDADAQPNHCAMLPFTRNAFDPMDFTPVNLYKIPTSVTRKTSSAYELALSVMFLSGIQHIAEAPDGMNKVPAYVKHFMQTVPDQWDETRFIDGYPGKFVVVARRSGSRWYISGINGQNTPREVTFNLSQFAAGKAVIITDGSTPLSFITKDVIKPDKKFLIRMQGNGGFVITTN